MAIFNLYIRSISILKLLLILQYVSFQSLNLYTGNAFLSSEHVNFYFHVKSSLDSHKHDYTISLQNNYFIYMHLRFTKIVTQVVIVNHYKRFFYSFGTKIDTLYLEH